MSSPGCLPHPAARHGPCSGGGPLRTFERGSRPRILRAENRKADDNDEDPGSRQYQHDQTREHERRPDDRDGDPFRAPQDEADNLTGPSCHWRNCTRSGRRADNVPRPTGRPSHTGGVTASKIVVVPHRPGPLISLETSRSQRGHDDLDELVDSLFPKVEEGPGWFDAILAIGGAGLLVWAWIGTAPGIVTVVGVAALALGCILPIRSAWRRAHQQRERRRREGLLQQGVPLDVSTPGTAALVDEYEMLLGLATGPGHGRGFDDPAISAAHSALLEVASLLKGRAPSSERQVDYVDKRTAALAALVVALRDSSPSTVAQRKATSSQSIPTHWSRLEKSWIRLHRSTR